MLIWLLPLAELALSFIDSGVALFGSEPGVERMSEPLGVRSDKGVGLAGVDLIEFSMQVATDMSPYLVLGTSL